MNSENINTFFSIIIPTFNSEDTIGVALSSIMIQSVQDLEVVIIDAASTDYTLKIAEDFQDKLSIRIYSEPDKGIYDAMNKGIKLSKGRWLYFMGSDDRLFEATTLKKILDTINQKNVEIIYGNVYSTLFNGTYNGEFSYKKLSQQNICHQAIFFKKIVFQKIGCFNIRFKSLADWDHNIRWFYSSKIRNKFVDITVANYAEGGFSSKYTDTLFLKKKDRLLLSKGIGKLDWAYLISICKKCIQGAKKENKYFLIIRFRLYKFLFMILNKIFAKY